MQKHFKILPSAILTGSIWTRSILVTLMMVLPLFTFASGPVENATEHWPIETYLEEGRPETCTYTSYTWNTVKKKAVDFKQVRHPYSQLSPEEIDPETACTVCEEDQITAVIGLLPAFRVCRKIAPQVLKALRQLNEMQIPIKKIIGYRVGKTRGKIDASGNRTLFSNHSFGIAIDINSEDNGLYEQCLKFSSSCRLIRGGPWHPDNPASLTVDGAVVKAFKNLGFRWGGEIQGRQKDFMHFSPTGY